MKNKISGQNTQICWGFPVSRKFNLLNGKLSRYLKIDQYNYFKHEYLTCVFLMAFQVTIKYIHVLDLNDKW